MLRTNRILIVALVLLAMGSTGCNLAIEKIFEMKEGSGVDVALITYGRGGQQIELPQGRLVFEGGTVMQITVSTSLLDYLDGTVNGDVAILDLLFGVPGFRFLIFEAGLVCVVLDDPPGGGTFQYDVIPQLAEFDMNVNTKALITNAAFASMIRDGAFKFPFHLQAVMSMTLIDALGLFTGTGTLEVTQALDAYYSVPMIVRPEDPSYDYMLPIHVTGEVTLATTDTFPATPTVLACLDYLGT